MNYIMAFLLPLLLFAKKPFPGYVQVPLNSEGLSASAFLDLECPDGKCSKNLFGGPSIADKANAEYHLNAIFGKNYAEGSGSSTIDSN